MQEIKSRNREKRIKKTKVSEGTFQKKVIGWLKSLGEDCYYIKTVRVNRSGCPDLIFCLRGVFFGLELKRDGERPEPLQRHHLKEIVDSGGVGLWACPENWEDVKLLIIKYAPKVVDDN